MSLRNKSALLRTGAWVAAAVLTAVVPAGLHARPGSKGVVRGLVRDASARPVAGADVFVSAPSRATLRAKTGPQGAYVVSGVRIGKVVVTIRAPHCVPYETRTTLASRAPVKVDARLAPCVVYGGRVVDRRGAPIAGVRVRPVVHLQKGARHYPDMEADPSAAVATDAEGRFVVDLVPGRRYVVRFQHRRHRVQERANVPGRPGESRRDVRITLDDAAWVSGIVLDEEGKPVAGARVSGAPGFVWPRGEPDCVESGDRPSAPPAATVHTDGAGRFVLGGFTRRTAELTIRAPGTLIRTQRVDGLDPGVERSGVEVRLVRASNRIEGTVLGPGDRPVHGAWIRVISDLENLNAYADRSGRFVLEDVHIQGRVRLGVCGREFCDMEVQDVEVGTKDLVVRMERAPVWRCLVTDAAGTPISKEIQLHIVHQGTWHAARTWPLSLTFHTGQGSGGLAVFLPARLSTRVRIHAEGYMSAEVGAFEPEPGATVDSGTVRLTAK